MDLGQVRAVKPITKHQAGHMNLSLAGSCTSIHAALLAWVLMQVQLLAVRDDQPAEQSLKVQWEV